MATVKVAIAGDNFTLSTPSLPHLTFQPTLGGSEHEVEVWGDRAIAIDQGDAIAQWFAELLQKSGYRLVRQSPQHPRAINPTYRQQAGDNVSFADGFPILLTQAASLADLNQRLTTTAPLPMARFRPNIVVAGDRPFAEDDWFELTLGELPMTAVKACTRCIVTTTDQTTGERNPQGEPLTTLAKFRQFKHGKLVFGENLIPQSTGTLKVGDRVQINSLKSEKT